MQILFTAMYIVQLHTLFNFTVQIVTQIILMKFPLTFFKRMLESVNVFFQSFDEHGTVPVIRKKLEMS